MKANQEVEEYMFYAMETHQNATNTDFFHWALW